MSLLHARALIETRKIRQAHTPRRSESVSVRLHKVSDLHETTVT